MPWRSAGRAAAEAVWVPSAMLARYGVSWRADSDAHLVADLRVCGQPVTVHIDIETPPHTSARCTSTAGPTPDGTGDFGWHPFGFDATGTKTFGCGLTIPAQGVGGWFPRYRPVERGRVHALLDP